MIGRLPALYAVVWVGINDCACVLSIALEYVA